MLKNLHRKQIILSVGLATFFFGFGAPAILNLYFFAVKSPLVLNFRSSLNFISSIVGDGLILPIVNMFIVSFLLNNSKSVSKLNIVFGLISGLLITIYFHVIQGIEGLVNWSMPTPWHWNLLGFWHAVYMFAVSSFLSLYFIVLVLQIKKTGKIPKNFLFVVFGIIVFLILLKLDYAKVSLNLFLPKLLR